MRCDGPLSTLRLGVLNRTKLRRPRQAGLRTNIRFIFQARFSADYMITMFGSDFRQG